MTDTYEVQRAGLKEVSTDRSRLDFNVIHSTSSAPIGRQVFQRGRLESGEDLSLLRTMQKSDQVGFGRLVTDYAEVCLPL